MPGDVAKDPVPAGQGPKISPGPSGQSGPVKLPGKSNPEGEPLQAAQKSHSGDKVPYTIGGKKEDFDAVKGTSVYILKDNLGNVLYVGEGDVWSRLRAHISDPEKTPWFGEIAQVEVKASGLTKKAAVALEQDLIGQLKPEHNKDRTPYETNYPGELYGKDLPKAQRPLHFKVGLGRKK